MHDKNKSYMGSTRVCPICSKEFAKQSDKWIYAIVYRGKKYVFCSWTCMRKWEEENGKN